MKRYRFNLISVGIVSLLLLGMIACDQEQYLENVDKSTLNDGTQWANNTNADIFLNDIYNGLINKWNTTENNDYYSDDYNISHYYTASNWRQGVVLAPSSSSSNPWFGTQGPTEDLNWNAFFQRLRRCNTFLQKIEENKENFTDDWYTKRVDEVRFLRAYFYSEVFMHMGGMPIIEVPLERGLMTEDEMLYPRSSFGDTFDWITGELSDIINNGNLAVKYNAGEPDAGRATLGAALALKGWLELFAASELFNSGTPYLSDPNNLVHFGSPRANLYAQAAATNKKFIDDYGNGNPYELYPDISNMWREATDYNSEVIWDRQMVKTTMGGNYERRGGVTYVLGQYMTWGNYNPTQEVVDEFRMANGKTIDDPESGYDPQNPYANREPRFYEWIVYDGAPYKLDWMPRADTIYTRIDETYAAPDKTNQIDLAGKTDVGDSGYYQKKKMNPDAAPADNANGTNFIYYRYAEVLLNYAEAQNEAVGPDASVYAAINKIRARGGIANLEPGLSKEQMRAAIRNERRVELCFEGKRFLDIIRWKIAEDVMGTARHNMVIRNTVPADNSGVWVYSVEPEVKYTAKFVAKQYMTPIPQDVIDQNPKIEQNPGY